MADASSSQSRADVICLAMAASLVLTGLTWIALKPRDPNVVDLVGREAQPALVIGRHYITERDSAPVQYNGVL